MNLKMIRETRRLLSEFETDKSVVFVQCGYGSCFELVASSRPRRGGVLAFESIPAAYAAALRVVERDELSVTLRNVAVGAESGFTTAASTEPAGYDDFGAVIPRSPQQVEVVSLDEAVNPGLLVSSILINKRSTKLDQVLAGAEKLLIRCQPVLFIQGQVSDEVWSGVLEQLGYELLGKLDWYQVFAPPRVRGTELSRLVCPRVDIV